MVWSFAFVRRPSSSRIAARTESPSWTRAARREGCGWGKWVIGLVALWHYAVLRNRLRRPLVRIPPARQEFGRSNVHRSKDLEGIYSVVNVQKDRRRAR